MLLKKFKRLALISTVSILSLSSISFAKSIEDFKDLDPNAWYANSIQEVLDSNLFNGVSDDEFAPSSDITRAMFVTVLGRKANISEGIEGRDFDDVNPNAYFANSVKWAAKNGIVKGIGENLFAPEQPISREDVAVMIDRYFKNNQENGNLDEIEFSDRDEISEYAIRSIKWANKYNIIKGYGGKVNPKDPMTRAEMAQVMVNIKDYENKKPNEDPNEKPNEDPNEKPNEKPNVVPNCEFSLGIPIGNIESLTITGHNGMSFTSSDSTDLDFVAFRLGGVVPEKCINLVNFNNHGYKVLIKFKLIDGSEKNITVLSQNAIVMDNKKYVLRNPGLGHDFIDYLMAKSKGL